VDQITRVHVPLGQSFVPTSSSSVPWFQAFSSMDPSASFFVGLVRPAFVLW